MKKLILAAAGLLALAACQDPSGGNRPIEPSSASRQPAPTTSGTGTTRSGSPGGDAMGGGSSSVPGGATESPQ